MKRRLILLGTLLAAGLAVPVQASDFVPLFNGTNLEGWVNVNCAPGTFSVRDGIIASTGVPTGVMRTRKVYENFELELEWRHLVPGGNAGLFVWSDAIPAPGVPFTRAVELQILDGRNSDQYTSHGDVFPIHGASFVPDRPHPGGWMRCLPSERRARPAGEWNHYRVVCSNGVIQLAVNGKVVSGGSQTKPRRGFICLESEGGQCEFRNLRLREWPSTHPGPEEIARVEEGFRTLYTGIDLAGWKTANPAFWQPRDWTLVFSPQTNAGPGELWTETTFTNFHLICDWRLLRRPASPQSERRATLRLRGSQGPRVMMAGSAPGVILAGNDPPESSTANALAKPPGQWNRFEITARDSQFSVELNGKRVAAPVNLSGVPAHGPLGLQAQDGTIEFANLLVKELDSAR